MTKEEFDEEYATFRGDERFPDEAMPRASNYVVFSRQSDQTFIVPDPPNVAEAVNRQHEEWTNADLRALTVDTAARWRGRDRYLRTRNRFRPHRQIRFEMPTDQARIWREALIAALKGTADSAAADEHADEVPASRAARP